MQTHRCSLRKNLHGNMHLQRAWNKYGESNFVFKPLIYCDPENAHPFEQRCLDELHPEYNTAKDTRAPMLGLKHSEEQKRKISKTLTGIKRSWESIQKTRNAHIGSKRSLEARQRMRESHLGIPLSEEHIRHRVESRKGYTHSEETRRKISTSNLGKKKTYSEEVHQRLSKIRKGRTPWNKGKQG